MYEHSLNYLLFLLQKVQQTLDTFKKKQQDIQENLKKLESKKDKDAKPIMETLYEQLRETEQLYQQVSTNTTRQVNRKRSTCSQKKNN